MKMRAMCFRAVAMVSSVALAACGRGVVTAPVARPIATPAPNAKQAHGVLVDDPSGTPLAGVRVQLDPWASYPTPGPTPTPVYTTTTGSGGQFTIVAQSGTYLLVIGDDDPSFPSNRPTIHDKLVFTGQAALAAPTMPPIPGVTPAPVETNGDYRLVTIDATRELPCVRDFDAQRAARGLPNPVIDEWLTENVRAVGAQAFTPLRGEVSPLNPFGFLTSGNAAMQGGANCAPMEMFAFQSTGALAYSLLSPWFAGAYYSDPGFGTQPAYGASLFPIDPRLVADPNAVVWP